MFFEKVGGQAPIGSVPVAPAIVPAGIVPKNVAARLPHQIRIAQIQSQTAPPIVGAESSRISYPRAGPIYRPSSLAEVIRVSEVPEIAVLPLEDLVPDGV